MEPLQDGKKKYKSKTSEQEIVPVHTSSSNVNTSVNEKSHFISNYIMKVKDDNEGDNVIQKSRNVDFSDWLSGGPIGSKGTVLVFRSCLLAPKESKNIYSSVKILPSSSLSRSAGKNSCNETDTFENNDQSGLIENDASAWSDRTVEESSSSTDTSLDAGKNHLSFECANSKRRRDIRDVLNDINKITFQRKSDIDNSTASAIKNNLAQTSKQSDDEEFDSGHETTSTKSSLVSIPNSHKMNTSTDSQSDYSSDTQSTSVQLPLVTHIPDMSLNFDSTFNEIYNKDYKDIKILDYTEMPAFVLNLTYKTAVTETKLLNRVLQAHGFKECSSHSKDYTLLWTGLHPKPDLLRSLTTQQRVNHFPRSYELTRKDKLFKNIEKMQHFRGAKNFDFVPITFLMPIEYKDLCSAHYRTKGPWIIKPAASSRGRGIYIVNAPDKIPKGESVVVAKYIDKPLLVDGHKCDLRLYVCVTSFDPLLIYMYEEGLVRFATVKYDKTNKNLWNPCMHLCNYSINKYHSDYIKCEDPSAENVGHKWTLSALLRHLRREGRDTGALMASIEDVVIKSILSCSQSIAAASRMFVPHFSNCFELYGFDILIDDTLKPWLLEINLSPSLGCDSPLDARLKSSLLADTLTLIGIPAFSSNSKNETSATTPPHSSSKPPNLKMRIVGCNRIHSSDNMTLPTKKGFTSSIHNQTNGITFLTNDESRIIKIVKAQYQRRGGYVRIFPSQDSWQKYAQYLDPVTGIPVCNSSVINTTDLHTLVPHNYNLLVHSQVLPHFDQTVMNTSTTSEPPERLMRYERVLPVCPRVSLEAYKSVGPSRNGSAVKAHFDTKAAKMHIKGQLERGMHLTVVEARRAFGMFLNCVLKRISNSKSEQSAHHAELIHRFLKRTANSLKMPYTIKSPSERMSDKDKAAMIAKQLNDFMYIYQRETDLYGTTSDQKDCVNNIHFAQFIYGANESDLEDILLTVLKAEGNLAPFLGDKSSPLCIDLPPTAITTQPGKSTNPRSHLLLRYLTYVTPLHSRRYRLPSPERASLPSMTSDQSDIA